MALGVTVASAHHNAPVEQSSQGMPDNAYPWVIFGR